MQRPFIVIAAATLFACIQVTAEAQTFAKPEKRLNPNLSGQTRIPAGIDSATSATSDSLPLGTPVPPVGSVDRADQGTRSAAARAAARPASRTPLLKQAATSPTGLPGEQDKAGECAGGSDAVFHRAMSACTNLADRADRANCAARATQDRRDAAVAQPSAEPVALPGSGFTGSSATASTRTEAAGGITPSRRPNQIGCV